MRERSDCPTALPIFRGVRFSLGHSGRQSVLSHGSFWFVCLSCCTQGMQKFPGRGSNLHPGSENPQMLNPCTIRELAHCSFNMCFSKNEWWGALVHVFIDHHFYSFGKHLFKHSVHVNWAICLSIIELWEFSTLIFCEICVLNLYFSVCGLPLFSWFLWLSMTVSFWWL